MNAILKLDDIHFLVPDTKWADEEYRNVHLDFNYIAGYFLDGEYIVKLRGLADTWNDLNLEDGLSKEDITVELLERGYLENYIMFFTKDNGEIFTDISITKIGYLDFKIDEYAVNEA